MASLAQFWQSEWADLAFVVATAGQSLDCPIETMVALAPPGSVVIGPSSGLYCASTPGSLSLCMLMPPACQPIDTNCS